ncbi:MAG: Mov34/MPN/PAD-1 family protein [Methanomassiliicoccales archaeon]
MRTVYAIKRDTLHMINEAAIHTYPNEFLAALKAEKGVISEIIVLPGTIQGDHHSIMYIHMLPADYSIVGSVHSHPGYSNLPSEADLEFFSYFGGVHVITCLPYDETSWKAYNSNGRRIPLQIVP